MTDRVFSRTIAERLRHEELISAELYDIVTVLICDVENFGDIVASCTPIETINFATDLFNYYETNIADFECINVDFYNTLVLVNKQNHSGKFTEKLYIRN